MKISAGEVADQQLTSGRVAARRWGSPEAPLLISIPGLSQDERSYGYLGARLGSSTRQVLAVAPRGRGRSETTAPGTYGWPAHARDVQEIATRLGQERFDVMGWSFGGFVGMQLAQLAPARVRRLVLIDVVGRPEPASLGPIVAGLERLGSVYREPAEYIDRVLSSGAVSGCQGEWRDYLQEDLVPREGGFTTRTNREAVLEDAAFGANQDPYGLWPGLRMPVLLIRAARPIMPGLGFVVPEQDRDRFSTEVPLARVVDVDTNHYCVGMVEETAQAVEAFLSESLAP